MGTYYENIINEAILSLINDDSISSTTHKFLNPLAHRKNKIKYTEKEFIEKYCCRCGSQRCEGIGTEWFDGCQYKNNLQK